MEFLYQHIPLFANIAHELAHIKRWDGFWSRMQSVFQVVYFFHPVVWFTNIKINQERERICDELVLANGISSNIYGKSMLTALKLNLVGVEAMSFLTFGDHKKRFRARIKNVIDSRKRKSR